METNQIYQHTTLRGVIFALYEAKKKKNHRFSIRAWAKQLNLKGHSFLHQIIKGDRVANSEIIDKIISASNLDKREAKFVEFIALSEWAKTKKQKEEFINFARSLVPVSLQHEEKKLLAEEYFKIISNWYHLVILEMTQQSDFNSSVKEIYLKLNKRVSQIEIKKAVARLIQLDLLEVVDHRWCKKDQKTIAADYGIPNEAIRGHHRQMIDLARKSIDLPQDKRFLRGSTFTIKSEYKEDIIDLVNNFHDQALKYAVTDFSGNETFQLNTQFFSIG